MNEAEVKEVAQPTEAAPKSDDWKDFDFSSVAITPTSDRAVVVNRRTVVLMAIVSAVGTAVAWLLHVALDKPALRPLLCGNGDGGCTASGVTAFVIGLVIVAIIGLFIVMRQRISRGVLTLLLTLISFAALYELLSQRNGTVASLLAAAFGLGLGALFAILFSLKNIRVALPLAIVLTVAFWLVAVL